MTGRRIRPLLAALLCGVLGGCVAIPPPPAPPASLTEPGSPATPPARALVGCYYRMDAADGSGRFGFRAPQSLLSADSPGDPSALTRRIQWAREAGIRFFAVDWVPDREHDGAVPDAAGLAEDFAYCFNWRTEDEPPPGAGAGPERWAAEVLERLRPALTRRFAEAGYLKIESEPVLIVSDPLALIRAAGRDAVRELLYRLDAEAREGGFRGLFVIGVSPGDGLDIVRLLEDLGFDAFTGGAPLHPIGRGLDPAGRAFPYADMVERAHRLNVYYGTIGRNRRIRYIPTVAPGWDERPRAGRRGRVEVGADPEAFEAMGWSALRNADQALPIVLVSSWNGFDTGDHLEPDRQRGFERLEALRRVFVVAETPPSLFKTTPAPPSDRIRPPRRTRPAPAVAVLPGASGVAAEGAPASWLFAGREALPESWTSTGRMAVREDGLVLTPGRGPLTLTTPLMGMPVGNLRAIVLEMAIEVEAGEPRDYAIARLAWRTTRQGRFTEYDSTAFGYSERGGWQRLLLVPSTFRAWEEARGLLVQARVEFGPLEGRRVILRRVAFEE